MGVPNDVTEFLPAWMDVLVNVIGYAGFIVIATWKIIRRKIERQALVRTQISKMVRKERASTVAPPRRTGPSLGSSALEHSTVNRMVAGSNPARGANDLNSLPHSTTTPL